MTPSDCADVPLLVRCRDMDVSLFQSFDNLAARQWPPRFTNDSFYNRDNFRWAPAFPAPLARKVILATPARGFLSISTCGACDPAPIRHG
jgi:hypothetical protein